METCKKCGKEMDVFQGEWYHIHAFGDDILILYEKCGTLDSGTVKVPDGKRPVIAFVDDDAG
ncbi:MAG: hypothetical protein QW292_14890 [Candidatus Parvarchaeota archaeon]